MQNCNVCTSVFHFITVLVLEGFLNSSSEISPRKEAPPSHFYSSQHVESGTENNCVIRVNSLRNHILKCRNGLVSNIWSNVVLLFFVWDHTSSLEIIHTRIDDRQFVWYYFYVDIIMYNIRALKFSPRFKLFRSCPLLKVVHTHQNFLEQNSKASSYRSMVEQLEGVPYVKRGEGLCYFDYNIFYVGGIKLSRYSR